MVVLGQLACSQKRLPPAAGPVAPGPAPRAAADAVIPAVPTRPVGPAGTDCLTDAKVEVMLESLRASVAPDVASRELRLVEAACHKRVYVGGTARFILWEIAGYLRGKATSTTTPQPSPACIERALEYANELFPTGERIIEREAAQDPELWRDPDVGLVSFLACDAGAPTFESIATMLHETNHRVSRGKCVFDFSADRDLCFELDRSLPPGRIALYTEPPKQLDAEGAAVLLRLQKLYLEQNGQGIRELFDEVMAYRIESELYAIGFTRKLYPKPAVRVFNNLPAMMALTMRYLDELAARDPELAAREFGPKGRNRAAVIALFEQAEASYKLWRAGAQAAFGLLPVVAWVTFRDGFIGTSGEVIAIFAAGFGTDFTIDALATKLGTLAKK